jgi:hypothetical protein
MHHKERRASTGHLEKGTVHREADDVSQRFFGILSLVQHWEINFNIVHQAGWMRRQC